MTLPAIFITVLAFGGAAGFAAEQAPPPQVPAPAASSSPKVLKEIGRVRATVCGNIVVHANGAISSALRNDATLGHAVSQLRAVDLGSADPLAYHNGVVQLDELAGDLHDTAVRGVGEVKRLRELSKESKDPARQAELEKFADSLGGALYRQKQASIELSGYVAYLQAREMRKTPEIDTAIATDHMDPPGKVQGGSITPIMEPSPFQLWNDIHGTLKEMSQQAAIDFEKRAQEISIDEGSAAEHAEGAVSGC